MSDPLKAAALTGSTSANESGGSAQVMEVPEASNPPVSSDIVVENTDTAPNLTVSDDAYALSDEEFDRFIHPDKQAAEQKQKTDETTVSEGNPQEEPAKEELPAPLFEDTGADDIQTVEIDGKQVVYDFKNAPENLRNRAKELQQENIRLQENALERVYLTDADKFVESLSELSPSQHSAVMQRMATESAQGNPEGWADYFVKTNPDLLVKKLFGDETLTKTQIEAEREMLGDEEREAFAGLNQQPPANPAEKAQQARMEQIERELTERKETERASQIQDLYQETVAPITEAVNRVISEAGLDVLPDDTPEEKAFKEKLSQLMPIYLEQRLTQDERVSPLTAQVNNFIENLDSKGARNLQMPIVAFAEAEAGEFIQAMTGFRAIKQQEREIPKELDPPPTVVTTKSAPAPAGSGFSAGMGISDSDIELAISRAG